MAESIYIGIIVVLFLLAISDLIVGVSNDAVNFLNSAIGSKVASFRTIMLIAGIGILVGATFSNGMMEVARKGIFHPDKLYFSEIMIVFLAVMLTDIILLDLFNTFGLPTSTTVSIVFELLGAAVAIAAIKVYSEGGDLSAFINTSKALAIISGILLSIVIAFTLGAIVQYITRVIFTFNYERTKKYFGGVFGGIAITAITYFLLIKGAKGSTLVTEDMLTWIKTNTLTIVLYSFIIWTVVLQLLLSFFRVNVFKFIVLIGTFTLAMAFAGNDLVNFIGVPLAGLASYQSFAAEGMNPDTFQMDALTQAVQTPTILLLVAGIIMTMALWFSRKAKSVTQTEITLGRQEEGEERFQASQLSRIIVRQLLYVGMFVKKIIPPPVRKQLAKRFETSAPQTSSRDGAHFDVVRASVILFVASIIVSFATSLKLPLSTTYVTFMVAMGASLSDKAWGRESAVYRITGVLTVVSGWFFTAFVAFTVSFIMVCLIKWGGVIAIGLIIAGVVAILINTHVYFRKQEQEKEKHKKWLASVEKDKVHNTIQENAITIVREMSDLYRQSISGLNKEDRKQLKKARKSGKAIKNEIDYLRDNIHNKIKDFQNGSSKFGYYYLKITENLKHLAGSISTISKIVFNHVDNQHKPLLKEQQQELNKLQEMVTAYIDKVINGFGNNPDISDDLYEEKEQILQQINSLKQVHIKAIHQNQVSKRNSALYLDILNETEYLVTHIVTMIDFEQEFFSVPELDAVPS